MRNEGRFHRLSQIKQKPEVLAKETNMKSLTIRNLQAFVLAAAVSFAAPALLAQRYQPQQSQPQGAPQMQPPAPATQSSICGTNPLCFEGANFVATISQFRTSTNGPWRLIDVIFHFQNKTNQPLILGYVNGSASGLDDRGNRYGLSGNNGVRAMGVINGNNIDPKFVLSPGAGSDAAFEWAWGAGNALTGVNYTLDLDVREMNPIEGGQWVLGQETMMHYQGLANGMGMAPVGGTPGQANASSQGGCPPAATAGTLASAANSAGLQNTSANTQSAVSNAQSAVSNLGSLFHKQKAANNSASATSAANGATPCVPATGGSAASGYAGSGGYTVPAVYNGAPAGTAAYPAAVPAGSNVAYPATTSTGVAKRSVTPTAATKTSVSPTAAAKTTAAPVKPVVTNAAAVQRVQPTTVAKPAAPVPQAAVKKTPPPPPQQKPAQH
jgi:hypothetical protein